jgi:hypothetical protein
MIPHGNWVLAGNPNQPDGLHLLRADDDRLKGIGVATGAGARAGP